MCPRNEFILFIIIILLFIIVIIILTVKSFYKDFFIVNDRQYVEIWITSHDYSHSPIAVDSGVYYS